MIYAIIFYCLTTIIVIIAKNCKNYATKPIHAIKICKFGISFFSNSRHKIKVGQVKMLILNNNVFLKHNNKTIEIRNVKNVFIRNDFIYFSALGDVKILFNAEPIFRYFNIKILSNDFNLEELKLKALFDVLNNLFDLKNCLALKEYLNVVVKILNIKITDEKVIVGQNKFNLSFKLIYNLNNVQKIVNVG